MPVLNEAGCLLYDVGCNEAMPLLTGSMGGHQYWARRWASRPSSPRVRVLGMYRCGNRSNACQEERRRPRHVATSRGDRSRAPAIGDLGYSPRGVGGC